MVSNKAVFPYVVRRQHTDETYMPYVLVSLQYHTYSISAHALIDSGSSVNVIPFSMGLQLGADWNKQKTDLELGGNLANVKAKGLLLTVSIGQLAPTRLAFAWAQTDQPPLIFGQMNFFQEFDVCFSRAELQFELTRRS